MAKKDKKANVTELSAKLSALMAEGTKNSVAKPSANRKTSSRSTWKGLLTVGALTFAVKTYTGTEEDKVEFHGYHSEACAGRLREPKIMICEACSQEVDKNSGVSMTEHNGIRVTMSRDEKAACQVTNDGVMTVLQFAKASDIDPMYFESTDYIAPGGDGKKPDMAAAKAFGLLRLAMVETGTVAITKRVNKGRDQIVALRPYGLNGIVMQHLYFENEIRLFAGWENVPVEVEAPMVSAAVALVNEMTEDFDPAVYGDSYLANLREAIAAKAAGSVKTFEKAAAPVASADLLATLQRSLDNAKAKPRKAKAS